MSQNYLTYPINIFLFSFTQFKENDYSALVLINELHKCPDKAGCLGAEMVSPRRRMMSRFMPVSRSL
ncbi:hypothetical protein RchiOBHm_Chr3g0476611 [Rosa chinensis]|uniref:Uncharacterized protein n=1 Tax=Rosa chinensis TaxID=74649 RepID=A0A2P6RCQ9_ROSCH|nr:hypothetical protein RchiOBHm_Chr3g0476611 [Rosa chinensis]